MRTRLTFVFDDENGGAYERQNILAAQDMRSAYEDFNSFLRNKTKYEDNNETNWDIVRAKFNEIFADATRGFE